MVNLAVNLSKFNSSIESWCIRAREGISFMVASEGGLVKDGLVAADEAPMSSLNDCTGIILNGQADVEDLAVVVHISIVAISFTLTTEAGLQGGLEKGFSISWEGVGQCGGSRLRSRVDYGCHYGDGSNYARENDGLHGDLEVMGWEQG